MKVSGEVVLLEVKDSVRSPEERAAGDLMSWDTLAVESGEGLTA